mmetsp:Transcript_40206/g.64441  ORF Transcript_40206/g.64441 Transcript_40206/m.64441 type:complete len:216 (-) Transcript_40206:513-1160(-)
MSACRNAPAIAADVSAPIAPPAPPTPTAPRPSPEAAWMRAAKNPSWMGSGESSVMRTGVPIRSRYSLAPSINFPVSSSRAMCENTTGGKSPRPPCARSSSAREKLSSLGRRTLEICAMMPSTAVKKGRMPTKAPPEETPKAKTGFPARWTFLATTASMARFTRGTSAAPLQQRPTLETATTAYPRARALPTSAVSSGSPVHFGHCALLGKKSVAA